MFSNENKSRVGRLCTQNAGNEFQAAGADEP